MSPKARTLRTELLPVRLVHAEPGDFPASTPLPTMTLRLALLLLCVAGAAQATDRIIDTATGREISRAELLAQARQSDFVLLGEIHDNHHHHQRRAALIAELAPTAIAAEHLEAGQQVSWAPTAGPSVAEQLGSAGFDARSWQWPIHEPLFAGLAQARIGVSGANISRDLARRLVREGESALPPTLAATLATAPLPASAQAALDKDLLDDHCGQLPATRVPGMRLAQRARDAAMAAGVTALSERPAVLVAGNGHVRADYGVPVALVRLRPGARIVNVAFLESERSTEPPLAYTHLWITPAVQRDDPCKGFPAPRS